MSPADQRAARGALAAAHPLAERLVDPTRDPEDHAADLIELWSAVEHALRAAAGGTTLAGRELVSSLRQRNLITIDQAHAAVELQEVRDRVAIDRVKPGEADRDRARAAFHRIEHGFVALDEGAPQLADTTAFTTLETPPDVRLPDEPMARPARRRGPALLIGTLALLLAAALLLLILRPDWVGIGGTPADVERGIAAYREGRIALAREHFARAAREHPRSAEAALWLGRVARDLRDDRLAAQAFSRAERLAPENPAVHREIGAFHLARGRWQPAADRYVRAVRLDGDDVAAQGWLACALHRQGNVAVARNFAQRAGAGPWTACLTTPPGPAGVAPPAGAPR